jgi:hypothetical protein
MGEVVGFPTPVDDTPHFSGTARCLACEHEWTCVAPVGCTALQCPSCGLERGRTKGPCWPESNLVWTCDCGNDVFVLTGKGALCIGCGRIATGWADA